MLFDLEDYKNAGIIGVARKSVENVYWGDSYTTWRATHDAYRKAVNEWFLASNVMAPAEDKQQLMVNFISIMDKFTESGRKGKIFFNALMSKSITAEIASTNGITEGTSLRIFSVSQGESWYNEFIDLPNLEYPTAWNWNNSKYVLFIGEDSPNGYSELQWRGEKFVYTTMTQAIYDDHKNAMIGLQAKIKETYLLIEGISDIPEWIAPEIPAWNESAELSGYVRDSRSLPISGATVRLVDADGVNHDLVTNDLGYYHFTKEYIYNNISFGTASSPEFDMFILEETLSGTVLYNSTNIFQNSFFGAINNRGINWPVLVKSGKQNRRNFKIEFIPDYSAYPSLSGHIYDQDGNPVVNSLVELFITPTTINQSEAEYMAASAVIGGEYNSNSGTWTKSSKYKLFGEEKSLLTDENGYYEYPSQMIGEWIHDKYAKYVNAVDPNSFSVLSNILINDPSTISTGFKIDKSIDFGLGFRDIYNPYGSDYTDRNGFVKQVDGKLIVAGCFPHYNGIDLGEIINGEQSFKKTSLVRINTDGTLDTTFQINVVNPWSSGNWNYFSAIDIQSDGKLIVAGNIGTIDGEVLNDGSTGRKSLVRLNSDGTLDTVFDLTTLYALHGDDFTIYRVKVLSNGKIAIFGNYFNLQYASGGLNSFYIFNTDGTIDTNLPTFINNFEFPINDIVEDGGGSFFVLTGSTIPNSALQTAGLIDSSNTTFDAKKVIRFNSDYSIDTTFNGFDLNGDVYSMIKETSGSYLLGGRFSQFIYGENSYNVSNLVRVNADGSFGSNFTGAVGEWLDWTGNGYGLSGDVLKMSIIDTSIGKRIVGVAAGSIFHIDYATGLGLQKRSGFNNAISHIIFEESDIYVVGKFFGESSYIEESDLNLNLGVYEVDGLNGIAKMNFGTFEFFKNTLNPWVSNYISYKDGVETKQIQWTINTVQAYLNPWIQNNSGSVYDYTSKQNGITEPTKIYDYQDWFNSRFAYAANVLNDRYILNIHGGEGKDTTLDIHELLVDAEYGAEIVYFDVVDKPISFSENGYYEDINLFIQTKDLSGNLVNRFRIVFNNGEKYVIESQNHTIRYQFSSNWSSFYIYSCNEHGAAEGNISLLQFEGPITSLDLNELSKIDELTIRSGQLSSLNLSESNSKNTLKRINISYSKLTELNISGIIELDSLIVQSDFECKIIGIDNCDISNLYFSNLSNYSNIFYTSKVTSIGNSLSYDLSAMMNSFNPLYPKYSFGWPNDTSFGDILPTEDGGFIILNDSTTISKFVPGMNSYDLGNGSYMPILKFDSNFDIDVNFSSKFSWFDYYRNWQNWDGSITTISTHLDGSLLVALRGNSGNGNTLWKGSYKGLIIKVDEVTGNANSTFSNNVMNAINPNESATIIKMHVCVDGKILVCGEYLGTEDYNGISLYKKLIRLNPNGSLDTTFSFYTDSQINGFEVIDDESILVFTSNGMYNTKHLKQDVGVDYGSIVKISSNGTIDASFSNNIKNAISNEGNLYKLGVSDTGKILVYGVLGLNNFTSTSDIVYGNTNAWSVAMFNSDGTRDDVWINNLLSLTGYTAGDSVNFSSSAYEWPFKGSSILFHDGYFFIPTYHYSGLFKSDMTTGQSGYGLMISSDATSLSYIDTKGSGGYMTDIKVVSGKIVTTMNNTNNYGLKYTIQNISPKQKYTFDLPGSNSEAGQYSNWDLRNLKVDSLTFKRPLVNLQNFYSTYSDELVIKSGFTLGVLNPYTFDDAAVEVNSIAAPFYINTKSLVKSDNSFVYNVRLSNPELITYFKEASYLEIYSSYENMAFDIDLTGFNNLKMISANNISIRNSVIPQEVSNSIKSLELSYVKGYENNGQYYVDFIENLSNLDTLTIYGAYGAEGDLLPYKQEFENAINSMTNLKSLTIYNLWRKGYSTEIINIENDSIERLAVGQCMLQLTSDKIRRVYTHGSSVNYDYTSLKIIGGSYWLTNSVPQSNNVDWDFRLPDGTVVPAFRSHGFVPDVTGWVSLARFVANDAKFYQNHVNFSGLQNLKAFNIMNVMLDNNSSSANIPWTYTPFASTLVKNVYLWGANWANTFPSSLNNSILQNLIDVGTTSGIYDLHGIFDSTGMLPLRQTLVGRNWTFRVW